MSHSLRLGVNVDHIATVRNARGTPYPDPLEAARLAVKGGADSITIHLREDRRHIRDADVGRMIAGAGVPVNLEMAVTDEMVAIAVRERPAFVCLVPERREEVTTEGGLDVAGHAGRVREACSALAAAGIQVSLFIDADPAQLSAAVASGAPHIEIHTGRYCDAPDLEAQLSECLQIARFARQAAAAGLEVHAGHGLHLGNVGPIAAMPEIVELNIGHALIARALAVGMAAAVAEMRQAMDLGRLGVA